MKKAALLFAFVLLFATTGYSQFSVTAGGGVSLPMGDLKNFSNTGFNFSGALNYALESAPVEISVTGGYTQFPIKANTSFNTRYVTVFGGVTYLFKMQGSMFTPYVAGRLGMGFASTNVPNQGTSSAFAWSPQVGFRYGFSPTVALDINAYYFSASKNGTINWLGIQGGVNIGFN